jgi:hypothetical protein
MGLDFKLDVKGLKELDNELKFFPLDMQRKALDFANKAYGKEVVKVARTNVNVRSGKLKRAIRTRKNTKKSKAGLPFHEIGVFRSRNKKLGEGWYGVLVEKGTRPHTITPRKKGGALRLQGNKLVKSVSHPGSRPKPWLRRSFDISRKRALGAWAARLHKWIEKEHRPKGKMVR